MKPGKQTFLKLCLAVLLLSAALLGIWRIWEVRHKPTDTADDGQMATSLLPLQNSTLISSDDGQMAAFLLPLQNPTLISMEHGYWPDIQEEVSASKNNVKKTESEKHQYSEGIRSPDNKLTEPVLSSAPTLDSSDDQWSPPLCNGFEEVEIEGKKIIMPLTCKPVIYLYPEAETEVTVRLEYQGRLTCTHPAPDPDGAW